VWPNQLIHYYNKQSIPNQQRGATRRSGKRRSHQRNGGDSVGKYFGDAWSLAKRTASGLNEIRKLINVETKILDTSFASAAIDQTGTVQIISAVAQGLNYTDRIGDSIKLQHIRYSGYFQVSAAALSSALRVIIFRDLYQQGVAPTTAQVLQNVGAQDAINQPKNWLLRDRFSILYDEVFNFSNTGDSNFTCVVDIPHEGHVKYIGTTSAAASNGFGSVYVMYVSTEATNKPFAQHFARLTFTDD